MANHYLHALFSNEVYNSRYQPTESWRLLTDAKKLRCNKDGNFARAYINHRTKEIIIAHRRTAGIEDFFKSDIAVAMQKCPNTYAYAEKFNVAVQEWTEKLGYSVSQTGHSLGAIHAEMCAIEYGNEAVTFESPGSKKMAEKYFKFGKAYKPKIINYLCDKNPVNSCSSHLGKILFLNVLDDKIRQSNQKGIDNYHNILEGVGRNLAGSTPSNFNLYLAVVL